MRINFLSFLLLAALCTPCMAFAQTGSTPKEAAKSFGKNSNHNKKDSKKIAKPVKRQLHLAGEKEFSCPRLADHEKTDYGTFLQGSNGWFFREEMDFSENFNLFSEARFYLKRYAAALQQRNITPVFVTIPPRSWIGEAFFDDTEPVMKNYSIERAKHNFHDYLQSFRNMGIITPDLGSMADKVGTDGETFFFKRDHHWMPYGARLSSNLVRDELSKSEKYNALPKKNTRRHSKKNSF